MLAKRFFYVCAGLLCLALSYHFGALNATAQAPGNSVVASFGGALSAVVTANGDVYIADQWYGPWTLRSNVFRGGPTPAQSSTFGSVKARWR